MPGDRGKAEALQEAIASPRRPRVLQTHPSLVPDAIVQQGVHLNQTRRQSGGSKWSDAGRGRFNSIRTRPGEIPPPIWIGSRCQCWFPLTFPPLRLPSPHPPIPPGIFWVLRHRNPGQRILSCLFFFFFFQKEQYFGSKLKNELLSKR